MPAALGHPTGITAVALSADERWAVSADQRQLRLWEVASGRCRHIFSSEAEGITTICASEDGRWLLTGGWNHTIRLWETTGGHCLETLTGHDTRITALNWSANLRWILSAGQDATMQLWELDWELAPPDAHSSDPRGNHV